jgi:hypothetical protein
MGSGETTPAGGQAFEAVARQVGAPLVISIMETPAGFELNSAKVAGRVLDFIKVRLQNFAPELRLIAARKRGTPYSSDSPTVVAEMLTSRVIFMGPGSPSYAVRQLQNSLAWDCMRVLHRLGTALVFASAATIAIGSMALPVYEIYKVGEDPYWKPGLDLLKDIGLSLAVIPHWNNTEGGSELDTSRCFIGQERFALLQKELKPEVTILGLDEHTALMIDLEDETCRVTGRSQVHIVRNGIEKHFDGGEQFSMSELGNFHHLKTPQEGIAAEIWKKVTGDREKLLAQAVQEEQPPVEVLTLVEQRQEARSAKDWTRSDRLRVELENLGWKVKDTPEGPRVQRS